LVIKKKGDVSEIIGWVDTGEECQNLRIIKDNKVEQKLARGLTSNISRPYRPP
jgi:hypothetical protein